jgi:alpha-D-ribose 1-methylphosphonate 5-triphosphate synthase subunit PhnI
LENRPFVPDHKVYFADFSNPMEAHYVCGILNSTLVKEFVQSHTIQIQVSNIFKHLSIPKFDPKDADHKLLAKASIKAHDAASAAARKKAITQMDKISERILK